MNTACIISVGNELLSGLTLDTNGHYLCSRLAELSIPVACRYTIGDNVADITESISTAAEKARIIIITGGLGPTDDDLTRHALADFICSELEVREDLLDEMIEFFRKRGRLMAEKNRIQAAIPKAATPMINTRGTAAGIKAEYEGRLIFCLPGVPSEMKAMFETGVLPDIESLGAGSVIRKKVINCFGTGESDIAQMLGGLMERERNPLINCTCGSGWIKLHIIAAAESIEQAEQMIEGDRTELEGILCDLVFGYDDELLWQVTGRKLAEMNKTLSVAESCTGGLVAKLMTDTPGASEYFNYGWVTYSNEAKQKLLKVDPKLIEKHGAVSEQVAKAMAEGAKKISGSDFSISLTGIAGPEGGTEQKPVGLVYICVLGEDFCDLKSAVFPTQRQNVRKLAAMTAINMLRLRL